MKRHSTCFGLDCICGAEPVLKDGRFDTEGLGWTGGGPEM
jgi:hypothetical protein